MNWITQKVDIKMMEEYTATEKIKKEEGANKVDDR